MYIVIHCKFNQLNVAKLLLNEFEHEEKMINMRKMSSFIKSHEFYLT